jgi:hypothetical protein
MDSLARLARTSVATIRYYEQIKLLDRASRSRNCQRQHVWEAVTACNSSGDAASANFHWMK